MLRRYFSFPQSDCGSFTGTETETAQAPMPAKALITREEKSLERLKDKCAYVSLFYILLSLDEIADFSSFVADKCDDRKIVLRNELDSIKSVLDFLNIASSRSNPPLIRKQISLSLIEADSHDFLPECVTNENRDENCKISIETLLKIFKFNFDDISEEELDMCMALDLITSNKGGSSSSEYSLTLFGESILNSKIFSNLVQIYSSQQNQSTLATYIETCLKYDVHSADLQAPDVGFSLPSELRVRDYSTIRIPPDKHIEAICQLCPDWDTFSLEEKCYFVRHISFKSVEELITSSTKNPFIFKNLYGAPFPYALNGIVSDPHTISQKWTSISFNSLDEILSLSHLEFESYFGFQKDVKTLYIPSIRDDLASFTYLICRCDKKVMSELFKDFPYFRFNLLSGRFSSVEMGLGGLSLSETGTEEQLLMAYAYAFLGSSEVAIQFKKEFSPNLPKQISVREVKTGISFQEIIVPNSEGPLSILCSFVKHCIDTDTDPTHYAYQKMQKSSDSYPSDRRILAALDVSSWEEALRLIEWQNSSFIADQEKSIALGIMKFRQYCNKKGSLPKNSRYIYFATKVEAGMPPLSVINPENLTWGELFDLHKTKKTLKS